MLKSLLSRLGTIQRAAKRILDAKVASVFEFSLDMDKDILKPPAVSHMKQLNREEFVKEVHVPCLKISDIPVQKVTIIVKPLLLKMIHLQPVISGKEMIILLNPLKVTTWNLLDDDLRERLAAAGVTEQSLSTTAIKLQYNNWNADEILRAILPAEVEIPRSFSKIGHIIHLNLRDHHLDYKEIIGQVLLDKIPNAKTVVNKTTKIDNTFRNFAMELICGEDNMMTKVKENNITYEFDFSKVYWNPRLSTEHQRVIDSTAPGDVLFDVFCGVGPFAIPCAKKNCKVLANDLNPNSFQWLAHNIKLNKVKEECIKIFNKDGADFIKGEVKTNLKLLANDSNFQNKVHVTMNLPAMALEFIQYFKELFTEEEIKRDDLKKVIPIIHVYFFVRGTDPEGCAMIDFQKYTDLSPSEHKIQYQFVRNVSLQKDMVKLAFSPPVDFLFKETISEPSAKRFCVEQP